MTIHKPSGGVEIPHKKWTSDNAIAVMDVPRRVVIPMRQHLGAPCEPVVKRGDAVKAGQVIGDSKGYVSAPIHSSVSGTVSNVVQALHPGGGRCAAVEIAADGAQIAHESVSPKTYSNKAEFLALVRASGLVGLGGAGFPAHVKLNPPAGSEILDLIVNGAECEPYITADYRLMVERADSIVGGLKMIIDAIGIPRALIAIEDNKPGAIALMKKLTAGDPRIGVVSLRSYYPQGAEKTLIYACLGHRVPPGKLPADVHALVMNVNSVSLIHQYITTGMPLVNKIVTVSGAAVANPGNVEAPIGTPLSGVFDFCGGFKAPPKKIIMGGPMMGVAQYTLDVPVIKNTNALLAFDEKEARHDAETACIRCGKCAESCPMRLLPLYINAAGVKKDVERLQKYHAIDCIECGACEYNCPAKRRIVQSARLGKELLRAVAAAEKAAAAAAAEKAAAAAAADKAASATAEKAAGKATAGKTAAAVPAEKAATATAADKAGKGAS